MIKTVSITNRSGETLVLTLGRPELSGFSIVNIEGLSSPKADINISDVLAIDGGIYNSSRLTPRNIKITVAMHESFSLDDLRVMLYKYLPIKSKVIFGIQTSARNAEIDAYVEANVIQPFSKIQTAEISLLCADPYFRDVNHAVSIFTGTSGGFGFPFSNESLYAKMLEFGTMHIDYSRSIIYTGDAEVGITVSIHANAYVENISLYNTLTNQSMSIDSARIIEITGSGIVSGDDIIIVTTKGYKSVVLIRDGVTYNILNALGRDTDWFSLIQGDNVFVYTADIGFNDIVLMIENDILYEGV